MEPSRKNTSEEVMLTLRKEEPLEDLKILNTLHHPLPIHVTPSPFHGKIALDNTSVSWPESQTNTPCSRLGSVENTVLTNM